jgi:hypothetical protein
VAAVMERFTEERVRAEVALVDFTGTRVIAATEGGLLGGAPGRDERGDGA